MRWGSLRAAQHRGTSMSGIVQPRPHALYLLTRARARLRLATATSLRYQTMALISYTNLTQITSYRRRSAAASRTSSARALIAMGHSLKQRGFPSDGIAKIVHPIGQVVRMPLYRALDDTWPSTRGPPTWCKATVVQGPSFVTWENKILRLSPA